MKNIAIVHGTFHKDYVAEMLNVVRAEAKKKKVKIVHEVPVPGSREKPLAVKRLLLKKEVDAVVVLGIIEKGETSNGFILGQAVISALINLQLEFMKPIGVGILGPDIQPGQIPPRVKPQALEAFHAAYVMMK